MSFFMKGTSVKREMNILAVCTGNICRSPMAEGILRTFFQSGSPLHISSAGTHAMNGNPAAGFSILASMENGVDIRNHRAKLLNSMLVKNSDIILCMEPSHSEWVLGLDSSASDKVYNLADFSGENGGMKKISDPYGCSLTEYRACFRNITECLQNFVCCLPSISPVSTDRI